MTAPGPDSTSSFRPQSALARVGRVLTQVFLFFILMTLLIDATSSRDLSLWSTLAIGLLVCAPLIYWPGLGLLAVLLYGGRHLFW